MNLNKSLSDIEKILSQHKSLKDYIDETGEVFVFASILLSLVIAPNPVSAIAAFGLGTDILAFRFSKFFNWLPEKLNYWNKGKEDIVVERYEKAMLVNMMVFHIAIQNGVKKIMPTHIKAYQKAMEKLSTSNAFNAKEHKERIEKEGKRVDEKIRRMTLEFNENHRNCIALYVRTVCMPLISEIVDKKIQKDEITRGLKQEEKEEILTELITEINIHYNSYLIHLSNEFPEFAAWVDLSEKKQILKNQKQLLKQLKEDKFKKSDLKRIEEKIDGNLIKIQEDFINKINITIREIEKLKDYSFEKSFGFEKLLSEQSFLSRKIENIADLYKEEKYANIEAHHNQIRRKLEENLVDNEDIENIVYPKNEEIFVPQSFKAITYQRKKHQKQILLDRFWDGKEVNSGENVGKFIMNELTSPLNSFKPIIILGNPGAGKSMLSSILSARLCDSPDFVPFFIRLRDVVLSDTNPKNHINEGIENTIEGNIDVDWISWAKEFNTRIPVIVLDGFDELLRASQAEINNYVSKLQELLINTYKDYKISARIILTSRLTVMQDVDVPNETTIIRLDSFDEKRQNQWIEQWNSFQTKRDFVNFIIPNNSSIKELAKEPLLLFMLGVYDFESSELQNDSKESDFNQSKLYDKLFNKFTYRQLDKDPKFGELSDPKKNKLAKRYRLRLGAISTLMFLNDVDHKDTQKLIDELNSFGIGGVDAEPNLVFKGFFFVHKDKSTEASGFQSYTFEFIHKSFGEFLAADFLIRVFLERFVDENEIEKLSTDDTLRFCWGHNWLHKHYNTTRFLFEHTEQLISKDVTTKKGIVKVIKTELKQIFGTKINLFPVSDFNLINSKPVLEHLAIYAQNLILLWVAINKTQSFSFNLFELEEVNSLEFKYEGQDRTEINKNKKFWKKITKLWELNGNKYTIAKLKEWVNVTEDNENILLKYQRHELKHNFSDSAKISCNDYELLLSFSDHPQSLQTLHRISKEKIEFRTTCLKILNDKFDIFFREDEKYLLRLAAEFLENPPQAEFEIVRLLENLNLHYPNFNSKRFFRNKQSEGNLRDFHPKMILQGTGNLPHWFARELHRTEKLFEYFPYEDMKNMGLNRTLKLIEYNVEGLIRIHEDIFTKLLEVNIERFIEEGSEYQLANYLSFFYKIPKRIRYKKHLISPDLIDYAFKNSFSRLQGRNKLDVDFFPLQYIKSFILSRVYLHRSFKDSDEIDRILPNELIERFFYGLEYSFSEGFTRKRFRLNSVFDFLELLVIVIKNKSIKIKEESSIIEEILTTIIGELSNEKNRYNHWHLPRFLDLLTILSSSERGDSPYRKYLFQFIEVYYHRVTKTERKNLLSYYDHLKLLKVITDFKEEFDSNKVEDCFLELYTKTDKLSHLNPRMRLQFAFLLNKSKLSSASINWKEISEKIIKPQNRDFENFREDLDSFRDYEYAITQEFNNKFYYEINYMDSIPYSILSRSILHGDKE